MTSQNSRKSWLLMFWYYCGVPNVKEIPHTKFGPSLSIWTIFTAFCFNLGHFSHTDGVTKNAKFKNVDFLTYSMLFTCKYYPSSRKKDNKPFHKSYIHNRIYCIISNFRLKAQNTWLPLRLEKKYFHQGEKWGIFWEGVQGTYWVSFIQEFNCYLPCSFYWTIL